MGFVVERDGKKWAIFEFIEGIIDPETLPEDIRAAISYRADKFAETIDGRLRSIGINPGDLVNKGIENMVVTGDPKNLNSLKFTIIDTEEWDDR